MAAKENKVVRRGVVLGKHLEDGFVSIDNFLQCLGDVHAEYARVRRQKVTKLFRKYDENKDGAFSLTEFSNMLEEMMPSLRKDQVGAGCWSGVVARDSRSTAWRRSWAADGDR